MFANEAHSENRCAALQRAALAIACGEPTPDAAELAEHLRTCAACRAATAADAALVTDLRTALEPEPLSPELRARLQALRPRRTGHAWRLVNRITGVAAAILLVAVLWQYRPATQRPAGDAGPTPDVSLASDATDYWDGSLEYALDSVRTSVSTVEQQISGENTAQRKLPWGPEDDWDLPPAGHDSSQTPSDSELCRAVTGQPALRI
jgi:hypothetical protein